jgi:hypothetical protein
VTAVTTQDVTASATLALLAIDAVFAHINRLVVDLFGAIVSFSDRNRTMKGWQGATLSPCSDCIPTAFVG